MILEIICIRVMLKVVKKVHPKFFVMENVKGMLSVAEQVKEDFRAIGYSVECHILNAKKFWGSTEQGKTYIYRKLPGSR